MLRKDAEREIIREWMNLPETERQSEHQAAQFALKMKRKYARVRLRRRGSIPRDPTDDAAASQRCTQFLKVTLAPARRPVMRG